MWRPFTAGHTSSSTSGFRLGRSLTCAVSMEGPSPIAALSFYIKGPTLEKNHIRAKNLGKPSAVSQPSLDSLASTLKRSPVSAMNEGRPSAAGHTSWGTRGSTVEEALWVQESLLQESRPHSTVHHPHWGEALWTQWMWKSLQSQFTPESAPKNTFWKKPCQYNRGGKTIHQWTVLSQLLRTPVGERLFECNH